MISQPLNQWYCGYDSCGPHYDSFNKEDGQAKFRELVNEVLESYGEGYSLSDIGQIDSLGYITGNRHNEAAIQSPYSRFDLQFPFGLPVGLQKPTASVVIDEHPQQFQFKESAEVGVLKGKIYPNFCIYDLGKWADGKVRFSSRLAPPLSIADFSHPSWTITHNLCQTPAEKRLLIAFIRKFVVAYQKYDSIKKRNVIDFEAVQDRVPALIPQVWINWNSWVREPNLRMDYDSLTLHRVDFVAFWNNRNFMIMLDGVEHYAVKRGGRWEADEQIYATRLAEDRILRIRGWNVVRLSNWEVGDETRLDRALEQLRKFIGFAEPPPPLETMTVEDIPF